MMKWNRSIELFLVLTISCSLCMELKRVNECIRCNDLNREEKTDIACPKTSKECGECLIGTMKMSDDLCNPINLDIVVKPKNITGVIGKSVMMTCEFNCEVTCEWTQQGSIINVNNDNYKPSFADGLPSRNCSFEITPFLKKNVGYWQCQGQTDFNKVKSFPVWLTMSEHVTISEYPQHEIVQYRTKFKLNCKFNIPVQCEWLHNGQKVQVKDFGYGPYKYVTQAYNTKREDCSIVITSFNKKDAGEWQCRNVPTNSELKVESYMAVLYGAGKARNLKGKCTSGGSDIILHCYMDGPGNCSWQRNNIVVTLEASHRYKFVNKQRINDITKMDCSIIIFNFKSIDVAEWLCEKNADDVTEGTFIQKVTPCIENKGSSRKKKKVIRRSISELISESASINLQKVQANPVSGNYSLHNTVTLECKFNKAIQECYWLRDGYKVDVEHRYSYTDGKNGRNTIDCTIKISEFQEIDTGQWICGSVADDQNDGVASNPISLNFLNLEVQYKPSHKKLEIILAEESYAKASSERLVPDSKGTTIIAVFTTVIIVIFILWTALLIVWFTKMQKSHEN